MVAIETTPNGRHIYIYRDFPRSRSNKVTEARALTANASPRGFVACSRPATLSLSLSVYTKLTHALHYSVQLAACTYAHAYRVNARVCELKITILHDKRLQFVDWPCVTNGQTWCNQFIHKMRLAVWSGSVRGRREIPFSDTSCRYSTLSSIFRTECSVWEFGRTWTVRNSKLSIHLARNTPIYTQFNAIWCARCAFGALWLIQPVSQECPKARSVNCNALHWNKPLANSPTLSSHVCGRRTRSGIGTTPRHAI